MEKQESFIPKKSFTASTPRFGAPGFALSLSFGILILSLAGMGISYFYNQAIQTRAEVLSNSLRKEEESFEPALINELVEKAGRIEIAKKLLGQHTTVIPIFTFLEESTLQSISFAKFNYSVEEGIPEVSMSGLARNYSALALQSEEFQKNKNIEDVSIANLFLDRDGGVKFDIKITFNPAFIRYKIN
jgi:hypothetical protein